MGMFSISSLGFYENLKNHFEVLSSKEKNPNGKRNDAIGALNVKIPTSEI